MTSERWQAAMALNEQPWSTPAKPLAGYRSVQAGHQIKARPAIHSLYPVLHKAWLSTLRNGQCSRLNHLEPTVSIAPFPSPRCEAVFGHEHATHSSTATEREMMG
jgi:hypothetical protein